MKTLFILVIIALCLVPSYSSASSALKVSSRLVASANINKVNSLPNADMTKKTTNSAPVTTAKGGFEIPSALKLVIGAGGIYAAFLYYGTLQEDVFHYKAADGSKFTQAWFLQALEALANVIIGGIGLLATGGTKNLPLNVFAVSGATQVCAKAFTSLALAQGVSFPIVTLAKSGKMVPVMIGSLLFGGVTYTLREYASVAAVIIGTVMVSLGKKNSGPASSPLGIAFVLASLACDGVVGGMQSKIKAETKARGLTPKPYDFMFWTNLFMTVTAGVLALVLGEINGGVAFCVNNPIIFEKILKFAVCSAIGQSFIFYTIANFDPLVCTTVTTTRKVFSVLLSIFLNGHQVSTQGWAGIGLASSGILAELFDKSGNKHHGNKDEKKK